MSNKQNAARKAAVLSLLSALAIVFGWLENLLLPVLAFPPGVKPGLSNVAVMTAAALFGWPGGILIALVKSAFAGVTRGLTAFLMSGAGGLSSALVTGLLLRRDHKTLSPPGIGILGAVTHNAAQLGAACLLLGGTAVLWSAPVLLLAAVLTGLLTGMLLKLVLSRRVGG
ncbi:MAG: Gx transporter family protein [Oscillospiraceae bacterium]|jgi:heptaprenyl diphosphate synthase|nr:Gx transporter family protein [Oscillospiraceae bacterium]